MWPFASVWRLGFADSSFWCVWWPDWKGFAGLANLASFTSTALLVKQVGQGIYSPLRQFLACLYVGLDSGTLSLTELWWPLCTKSFGELYLCQDFAYVVLLLIISLYLPVCRSCWEPWNTEESSILGLVFWCEDRSDTFGVYRSWRRLWEGDR